MIITVIIIILFIFTIQRNGSSLLSEKRELTIWTKFIASQGVVLGHLCLFYSQIPILQREFGGMGLLFVNLFLFFSGYGLMFGYLKNKEGYANGFLKKRIPKLLIPYITAYILYLVIYLIVNKEIDFNKIPDLPYSWYVWEVIMLYIMFYLAIKFIPKQYVLWGVTMGNIILACILILSQHPVWWTDAIMSFSIGVWYQTYERKISNFISNYKILFAATTVIIFFFSYQIGWISTFIPTLSAYRYTLLSWYIIGGIFVSSIVFFSKRCNFTPNTHITHITHWYYEVYLSHGISILIITQLTDNKAVIFTLTFVITFALSYLLSKVNHTIFKIIK